LHILAGVYGLGLALGRNGIPTNELVFMDIFYQAVKLDHIINILQGTKSSEETFSLLLYWKYNFPVRVRVRVRYGCIILGALYFRTEITTETDP
jgi:hypothetical protein